MLNKTVITGALLAPAIVLTSCVDDGYDLSDVDTNARFDVKDLVVPINLDALTLKSMFDLEEDGCVKEVNGEYCIVESGSFSSDVINIDAVTIAAPRISPSVEVLATGVSGAIPSGQIALPFSTGESSFSTGADNVSSSIVSIEQVSTTAHINVVVSIAELAGKISRFELRGLNLQLPSHLSVSSSQGSYDPATGVFTAESVVSAGNEVAITLDVDGVSAESGSPLSYDYSSAHIDFAGSMRIAGSTLVISASDLTGSAAADFPSSLTLNTAYNFSDIAVETFTGDMRYDIEGAELSDVELNDLPDVLSQPGTDVSIYNPQIYLSLDNPLSDYGVYATSGFAITPYREDVAGATLGLDAPGYFTVTGVPGHPECQLYFAPHQVSSFYEGYANPAYTPYSGLSEVLSGDGLPSRLEITLDNPQMPVQRVENFSIGRRYGAVEGRYDFFAPIALKEGSTIIYTDDLGEWDEEELDNITISALTLTADVSSDLPAEFVFTGYPIDRDGNKINNVDIRGAQVSAMATGEPIEIYITGEITGIYGIRFEAHVTAGSGNEVLRPEMHIDLDNLRAKVSGFYQKEL